ncbi:MAG: hypothetical protein HUU55_14180 [Myxococcales bacterium]|nr:hypothetical protein [Myxococcales bacterium]
MRSLVRAVRVFGVSLILSAFLVGPAVAEDAPSDTNTKKATATQKVTKKTNAKVTTKKVAPIKKDMKTKDVKPAESPTNTAPSKGMQM